MPTITVEVSPCSVCGRRIATFTQWQCKRCGHLACMADTKKSTSYGGYCLNCLPLLNPYQQQLLIEENASFEKLYNKYAWNPKKNREWRKSWSWETFKPLPESPQVQVQQQAAIQAQGIQQAHENAVQLERPGGFLHDGKWDQGTLKLTNTRFEFSSKKTTLSLPLSDITGAVAGDKGNLFTVQVQRGDIHNFRAEKGKLWAERISAAITS